ncbi:unnamed protein product [Rhizophagus irregularis]|nr:unnamed protein product [Rhizophagus irregularis]
MAYTKIFSGELPEITKEIIQYFRNDFSTLHSCILVNRLWCRMTIPFLWENPFSLKYPKNYYYIEVYLYNLSDDDKIQSKKYGINNDLFPSKILFNYSSFIQYLDIYKIYNSITMWVSDVKKFKPLLVNIKHSQHYDFVKFIYKSLIKIFNENEANLHTLDITHNCTYLDTIVSELALNPNFFYNIRNLYLKFYTFIKKVELSLNYISIDADDNVNLSSVVLQNLGQILEKFTNHFINKLLIKDTKKEELENKNNLSYIKEYIMKKKRIKFLALIEIIVDLFSLKDEVNEFRLYDIIVQNYCDLSIETDEFIYEMY